MPTAIVTDEEGAEIARDAGLPILVTDDPRGRLAAMAAWVYGNENRMPLMLGVTGTNGKTSTTHFLAGLLRQLGVVPGMSSSAERHIGDQVITSRLTTPEASELHALLALMRERGVETMALEVSVQGLVRHRVDGIVFDVAAFTNLSYDHMDDFRDMREYLDAKLAMFRADRARKAVVSLDSLAGRVVAERAEVPVTTIGMPEIAEDPQLARTAEWQLTMREETAAFTSFTLVGPEGQELTTRVSAIGPHMASDGGLAIVMLLAAGYAWDDIVGVLERDGGLVAFLPGRAELVTTGRGPSSTSISPTRPTPSRRPSRRWDASPRAGCSRCSAPTARATRPSVPRWGCMPLSRATSRSSPTITRAGRTPPRSAPASTRVRSPRARTERSTRSRLPRTRS